MTNTVRLFLLALVCVMTAAAARPALSESPEGADYAGAIRLDMASESVKMEVTVKTFIDGDTTHFYLPVPEALAEEGVLKARYLACNTPESTGKIEEWGKKASRFTREALEGAESIIVESDNGQWNLDSTGTRYLVWVWYKPPGGDAYRNLNIELLQNGLAIANSSAQNRYGETCMAAIAQARAQKLNIYSGQKDPDFFYGDAVELTLRELRLHPEAYEGKKVAFSGVITLNHNNSVFIEDYDPETELYFGISAYYGFNMSGAGLDVLSVGNEARIVGTMQYYEAGDTWQVSGLTYRMMKPKDPGNIQKLSDGHSPSWKKIDPETFCGAVTLETEDGPREYAFAWLAQDTTVSMTVQAEWKDTDAGSLICLECSDCGPDSVLVYSLPLYDETGALLTPEAFENKTVRVRGVVDTMDGYCIRVYTQEGVAFLD